MFALSNSDGIAKFVVLERGLLDSMKLLRVELAPIESTLRDLLSTPVLQVIFVPIGVQQFWAWFDRLAFRAASHLSIGNSVILVFFSEQLIPGCPLTTISWNKVALAIEIEIIPIFLWMSNPVDRALVKGIVGLGQCSSLVAQTLVWFVVVDALGESQPLVCFARLAYKPLLINLFTSDEFTTFSVGVHINGLSNLASWN